MCVRAGTARPRARTAVPATLRNKIRFGQTLKDLSLGAFCEAVKGSVKVAKLATLCISISRTYGLGHGSHRIRTLR